jgi:hypothetical protein
VGIEKEYLNAFEVRFSHAILEKHSTAYSLEALENSIYIMSKLTYGHIFTE